MSTQRGHNLIELMVCLSVATILLHFVFKLYLDTHTSTEFLHDLNHIKVDAYIIMQNIRNDLSLAGYMGCRYQPNSVYAINNVLSLRYASFPRDDVLSISNDKQTLVVTRINHYKSGQYVVISDCKSAEIVKILKVTVNQVKLNQPLIYHYDNTTQLSHYIQRKYYLEHETLYREDNSGTKIGIADNITSFTIKKTSISFSNKSGELKRHWFIYRAK